MTPATYQRLAERKLRLTQSPTATPEPVTERARNSGWRDHGSLAPGRGRSTARDHAPDPSALKHASDEKEPPSDSDRTAQQREASVHNDGALGLVR